MLFPTIERMAQTPQGKIMTPVLCEMRYLAYLPVFLLSLLPVVLKTSLTKLLLGGICSLDHTVVQPTVGLLSGDCAGGLPFVVYSCNACIVVLFSVIFIIGSPMKSHCGIFKEFICKLWWKISIWSPTNKQDFWLSQTCNFFKKLFCSPLVICIKDTCPQPQTVTLLAQQWPESKSCQRTPGRKL